MKIKILIIIGLTAFLCLSGATAHAQSDKQIINMDNPDYDIDVERLCSPYIDFDNPKETSKEVSYRYVKYTQNMNVSFSERYPILIYYISMDSLVTKKAIFCDTDFGKLNLITNAQGKLISMVCETKMNNLRVLGHFRLKKARKALHHSGWSNRRQLITRRS